jgi:hypothetical protein
VALNTGDMLALNTDPEAMKLRLKSEYGTIELNPAELLEIVRNQKKGAKGEYLALFKNGSQVSGNFEGDTLALQLKLGSRKADIPRDKILLMFFGDESKPNPGACQAALKNTDKLLGSLNDKGYRLTTDFGEAEVAISKLKQIIFTKSKPDAATIATIEMQNGTILRGRLDKDNISFKVGAKILLSIPTSMLTSLTCPDAPAKPGDKAPPPPPVILPPIPGGGRAIRVFNGDLQLGGEIEIDFD